MQMAETTDTVIDGILKGNVTGVIVVPNLPISIISDVLSRLHVNDLARCTCVCKAWYNLSKDSQFTHFHCSRSSETFQHQRQNILIWKADDSGFYRMYIRKGGLYLLSNIQQDTKWKTSVISHRGQYVGGTVLASCNGLLCMYTRTFNFEGPDVVYNPLTEVRTMLPEIRFHPHYESHFGYCCGFGFDSINRKYKIVLTYDRKCYREGSSDWYAFGRVCSIITLGGYLSKILLFPDEYHRSIYNRTPLFFNGAFHWTIGAHHNLDDRDNIESHIDGILALDISSEKFTFTKFSNSLVLPGAGLEPINWRNSLALYEFKNKNLATNPSLEIWQILGANSDGSCLYKHKTFNLSCSSFDTVEDLSLRGAFNNGDFLFEASRKSGVGCNNLIIYDAEKDEGSVIEIAQAPKYFLSCIFTPSLISPLLDLS